MFRPILAIALGFLLMLAGPVVGSLTSTQEPSGLIIALAVILDAAGLFILIVGLRSLRVVREYRASERDSADS